VRLERSRIRASEGIERGAIMGHHGSRDRRGDRDRRPGSGRTRRLSVGLTAVAAAAAVALPASAGDVATSGAGDERCFETPADSVFDGDNVSRTDAVAARADILEVCAQFTADELVLTARIAEPTDPGTDANWTLEGQTHLAFLLATTASQEFPEDDVVIGGGGYGVVVMPQPTGGWRAMLSDSDGAYRCDGVPEFLPGHGYRVTLDVSDATACFDPGEDRIAVRPLMVYDTDPGDDANQTLRIDSHPGQDGHFGWIERAGTDGGDDGGDDGDGEDGTSFADVGPDNVHADNIAELARREITEGDGRGNFNPSGTVTRAQLATFLARAFGLDPVAGDHFTDVATDHVHAGNIYAVADAGITQGTSPTTFDPGGTLTRRQMASMLARAFELAAVDGDHFTDVHPDDVHAGNIYAVAEAGITHGTSATTFSPGGTLRRDQFASLLIRGLDSQAEAD
jgi:hypothetical protein